jgi:hypothetical protein
MIYGRDDENEDDSFATLVDSTTIMTGYHTLLNRLADVVPDVAEYLVEKCSGIDDDGR